MDGSVAPALVEEAAGRVEPLKVLIVGGTAEEVEAGDLKVAPEVAQVVGARDLAVGKGARGVGVVDDPGERVVGRQVVWVLGDELLGGVEQGGDSGLELEHGQHPAVDQAVLAHEGERVIGDVTPKLDVGLDAPVPVVFFQGLLAVEEARVKAAHVAVRERAAVDDALRVQALHALVDARAVERGGDAPVALGDLHVLDRAAG